MKCPKCQFENPSDSKYCKECGTRLLAVEEVSVTKTLETPREELTRGTLFAGRYEIIEELGKGGMGKVYRVEDKKIKEEVALKLVKPEISADKKTIERFSNELKLARKIRNKHICGMYDLGREKGAHYITMEYVPGEDLKSFIRRIGQLPVDKAISIAKQTCEGLSEAHRLGVVHRDLKPSNIMIDKEGNARIMDFGIARSLKAKRITGAGVMIGTPEYMSPEQVEGKDTDQRSDIYSLGVILYEMLTGQLPFEGDTPLAVAMKHKGEMPKDPKEYNAQIPDDLSHLILKCLEKEKEKRFQSAGEVHTELENIENGIPTIDRGIPKRKVITSKEITVTFGLKKLLVPALIFIAVVVIGIIIWQVLPQKESPSAKPEKISIAVLPFEDLTPVKKYEYLCDGIAETLMNSLSPIKELKVPARTSAFSFKGKEQDIREIGQKLDVKNVLEGSVQVAGNRIRVTARLSNAEDGFQLWSESYNRDLEDIFAIQDDIAQTIVKTLKIQLLREKRKALVKRYTENIEAYNLYLMGRHFLNKRTADSFHKAKEYFEQTIKIEPGYALAYVGFADTYILLGAWGLLAPHDAYPKAEKYAKKALELDDSLGEAYTSLAFVQANYKWDWDNAEKDYRRAIELNPNYATAYHWYAFFLSVMGRYEEAIRLSKKALELDPISLQINALISNLHYYAADYDMAIEECLKAKKLDPDFGTFLYYLGLAYGEKKMYKEAIAELQKLVSLQPEMPENLAALGHIYAAAGKRDEARKVLEKLKTLPMGTYIPSYCIGIIYAGLKDNDRAFEYLEKAYDERSSYMNLLKVDPKLDVLRSEPRFKALLKKINLE